MLQTEITNLRAKKESRFQRLQKERDRLAEQLKVAAKVEDQLQHVVIDKETEADGWKREKEKLKKEIQDLQDDLAARRQEVYYL